MIGSNRNIRQGKCEFADSFGVKHTMIWTVGLAKGGCDKKSLIRKTDIWLLRILVDEQLCVWFESGAWNCRPPLLGIARDAYKMVMALYS